MGCYQNHYPFQVALHFGLGWRMVGWGLGNFRRKVFNNFVKTGKKQRSGPFRRNHVTGRMFLIKRFSRRRAKRPALLLGQYGILIR